jgi:hypothetical protein
LAGAGQVCGGRGGAGRVLGVRCEASCQEACVGRACAMLAASAWCVCGACGAWGVWHARVEPGRAGLALLGAAQGVRAACVRRVQGCAV